MTFSTIRKSVLPATCRVSDKVGSFGAIVAAMGCASCFPAIASLGASLGLGFLAQYEGLFITILLPVFAIVALAANLLSAWSHRRPGRMFLGIVGPILVLATLYLFWAKAWSIYIFYLGLAMMFAVSIYDLVSPPRNTRGISTQAKN